MKGTNIALATLFTKRTTHRPALKIQHHCNTADHRRVGREGNFCSCVDVRPMCGTAVELRCLIEQALSHAITFLAAPKPADSQLRNNPAARTQQADAYRLCTAVLPFSFSFSFSFGLVNLNLILTLTLTLALIIRRRRAGISSTCGTWWWYE